LMTGRIFVRWIGDLRPPTPSGEAVARKTF
jgi:hypothetical protein